VLKNSNLLQKVHKKQKTEKTAAESNLNHSIVKKRPTIS